MKPFLKSESAFTLVELLVVITIISLLIMAAVPSFLGQQDTAFNSEAQQNVSNALRSSESLYSGDDYPILSELVSEMSENEPGYTFVDYNNGVNTSSGPANITVSLESPRIISLCSKSQTNIYYCARHSWEGSLLASAAPLEDDEAFASSNPFMIEDAQAQSFSEQSPVISRCSGLTEQSTRQCLATSIVSARPNATANPGWTESIEPLAAPQITALPQITGEAKIAFTLSASLGSYSGDYLEYSRKWLRCDASGSSCSEISGQTSSTYTLVAADVGKTIRHQVIASNPAGQVTARSAQTLPVQGNTINYDDSVLADNPTARCRFNESGTQYLPLQCLNITGQYQDTTPRFTTGQEGAIKNDSNKSIAFNGQTHYSYGNPQNQSTTNNVQNWSAEAWVRPATSSSGGTIVSANDNWVLRMAGTSGFACDMRVGNPWSVQTITGGNPSQANTWYHVVCTYNHGVMKLYVNGAEVASKSGVGLGASNIGNFSPGYTGYGWAGGSYLNGRIDEFAFYKSTLSQQKILAHYQGAGY